MNGEVLFGAGMTLVGLASFVLAVGQVLKSTYDMGFSSGLSEGYRRGYDQAWREAEQDDDDPDPGDDVPDQHPTSNVIAIGRAA